jgi:carboxypeptidase Q
MFYQRLVSLGINGCSVLALICTVPSGLPAQSLDHLKKQALEQPAAYRILQQLSDGIGPRLTGSPQESRAGQWALRTMRAIGLQNVHSESWQLEAGWKRGYARAELVEPFLQELAIVSHGWTGSSPRGPSVADVVQVDSDHLADEAGRNSSKWTGKALFIAPKHSTPEGAYGAPSGLAAFLDIAKASGVVAVIDRDSRPGISLVHAGPAVSSAHPFSMAFASVGHEQGDLITRLLNAGTRVRIRLDIRNDFSQAAVLSRNIVGEIPGYLHPKRL